MKAILTLATLLILGRANSSSPTPQFSTPSQAWAYANAPVAEWDASVKARKVPKSHFRPDRELYRRAGVLCPSFPLDSVSGEEMYWLAKLCEKGSTLPKAISAAERYLALGDNKYRPDAHLLLAGAQMRISKTWEAAWETLLTILREDPMEPNIEMTIRVAIDEEGDKNEAVALRWSQERYSLLLDRAKSPKTERAPITFNWVVRAGTDLVHRSYVSGDVERGSLLLAQLNELKDLHRSEIDSWSEDWLNWANMELKPAPSIPVLKSLGRDAGSDIIQKGRVEVVHFFFLRCLPCISDLENLSELQKRYKGEPVLVANVTTYKAALQPDTPPHAKVESALDDMRRKKSPRLNVSVAPEQTLGDYKLTSFPVIAVVDKAGRLRYAGVADNLSDGEEIDRLVRRLMDEPSN